jgi:hypothetical protein
MKLPLVCLRSKPRQRMRNSIESFIEGTSNSIVHGPLLLQLRHAHLTVRQRLPLTYLHPRPLRELRKSFPRTRVFFPSRSFPSKGRAIPCKRCNMWPSICASIFVCSISIFRRSMARCLLINKCLDARSVNRRLRSAILVSSVSAGSIHFSHSVLSSYSYSRSASSKSSSEALPSRLGLNASGSTGLKSVETPPSLVLYRVPQTLMIVPSANSGFMIRKTLIWWSHRFPFCE